MATKPDNILRVRLDAPHWQLLNELCQTHDRETPDMVRKMIRDEHARMGKGKAKMITQDKADLIALSGCQTWEEVEEWFAGMTTDEIEAEANRCWPHEISNRQFAERVYNAL